MVVNECNMGDWSTKRPIVLRRLNPVDEKDCYTVKIPVNTPSHLNPMLMIGTFNVDTVPIGFQDEDIIDHVNSTVEGESYPLTELSSDLSFLNYIKKEVSQRKTYLKNINGEYMEALISGKPDYDVEVCSLIEICCLTAEPKRTKLILVADTIVQIYDKDNESKLCKVSDLKVGDVITYDYPGNYYQVSSIDPSYAYTRCYQVKTNKPGLEINGIPMTIYNDVSGPFFKRLNHLCWRLKDKMLTL